MTDRVLEAFLERQLEEGTALARSSNLLQLLPAPLIPPDRYLARFHCRGLVLAPDGEVVEADDVQAAVGIGFPPDYLRRASTFQSLCWIGPTNIFHPNISAQTPHVCIGRFMPGTPLVDILYSLFELLTFVKWNTNDALNQTASAWARRNPHRFPIDRRPLKRRGLRLTVCPARPEEDPSVTDLASVHAEVAAALRHAAPSVRSTGANRWRLGLEVESTDTVEARLEEDWLLLETSIDKAETPDVEATVEWNHRLPGLVRLVLGPGDGRLHLRAELPVTEDTQLALRLTQVLGGFSSFLSGAGARTDYRPEPARTDLARLCGDAGWPLVERVARGATVALEVKAEPLHAVLELQPTGGVRARVVIASAPVSARALALLLATAGGVVRLARPTLVGDDDRKSGCFEVSFPSSPTAAEIHHALAALSVAGRLCGSEARLLARDTEVAAHYIEIRSSVGPCGPERG